MRLDLSSYIPYYIHMILTRLLPLYGAILLTIPTIGHTDTYLECLSVIPTVASTLNTSNLLLVRDADKVSACECFLNKASLALTTRPNESTTIDLETMLETCILEGPILEGLPTKRI